MPKISEIDLGSALLSTFILIGFIATAFVLLKLSIIGINYINANFSTEKTEDENKRRKINTKGF